MLEYVNVGEVSDVTWMILSVVPFVNLGGHRAVLLQQRVPGFALGGCARSRHSPDLVSFSPECVGAALPCCFLLCPVCLVCSVNLTPTAEQFTVRIMFQYALCIFISL